MLLLIGYAVGGFSVGPIRLTPELIEIPYLGRFELGLGGDWRPFVQNLFVLANCHLMWYLAIPVVVMAGFARAPWLRSCSVLVVSWFAMLFVLFVLTGARQWVEQYTSINRLLLHITPALIFYLLILMNALRASRRVPESVPQSG